MGNANVQVSADSGLVLVAEPFIDVLVHERRLAYAELRRS